MTYAACQWLFDRTAVNDVAAADAVGIGERTSYNLLNVLNACRK